MGCKLFSPEKPLLIAHRGYSSLAPENTLPAFALVREHGIPGVELDVQCCATGELVVMHDETVDRTTDGTGRVDELPWSDLSRLNAGCSSDNTPTGIPLLSEVFELLGDSVVYDIEIKSRSRNPGRLELALLREIERHRVEERCIVSSFNPLCVRYFRKIARKIPVGVIYSDNDELPRYLRAGQGRFLVSCSFLKPEFPKVNSSVMVALNTALGWPILPWTVDDPDSARELLGHGVSGIITNDPGSLKTLFDIPTEEG